MDVHYSESASSTPAFALLAEAWLELLLDGLTPDFMGVPPYTYKTQVLYVGTPPDVVGVLAFEHLQKEGVVKAVLAYVEPSSRRTGIFSMMVDRLLEIAATKGCKLDLSALAMTDVTSEYIDRLSKSCKFVLPLEDGE